MWFFEPSRPLQQNVVQVPVERVMERVVTVPQHSTREVPVERIHERVVVGALRISRPSKFSLHDQLWEHYGNHL